MTVIFDIHNQIIADLNAALREAKSVLQAAVVEKQQLAIQLKTLLDEQSLSKATNLQKIEAQLAGLSAEVKAAKVVPLDLAILTRIESSLQLLLTAEPSSGLVFDVKYDAAGEVRQVVAREQ